MRNLILNLFIAASLIACSNIHSEIRAYHLEKGFSKKGSFQMVNTTDNPPYFAKSELNVQFDLNLKDISGGNYFWELNVSHVKMIQGQPIGEDIYYDSDPNGENSALSDGLAGTYNALLNTPIPLTTNGFGQIITAIDYEQVFGGAAYVVQNNSNLSQILKYLFLNTPKKALAHGDVWDSTYVLNYSAPVKMTDSYEFIDADGRYGIDIITKTEIAEHPEKYDDVKDISGSQKALLSLSPSNNFIESMTMSQTLKMEMEQNGTPTTVNFKTSMILSLN